MHFQYLNCKQNASNLRLDGYLYSVMCPFYHTFFHTVCLLSEANDAKIQKCLTKKIHMTVQSTIGLRISQIFPWNAKQNKIGLSEYFQPVPSVLVFHLPFKMKSCRKIWAWQNICINPFSPTLPNANVHVLTIFAETQLEMEFPTSSCQETNEDFQGKSKKSNIVGLNFLCAFVFKIYL